MMNRQFHLPLAPALVLSLTVSHCGPMQPTSDAGTDSGVSPTDSGVSPTDSGVSQPDATPDVSVPDARPDSGGGGHSGDVTRGRLVVADGRMPAVQVWDLDTRMRVGEFTVSAPATPYANTTGVEGVVYLTQRANNRTDVLVSGVEFSAHDDHFHVSKRAPTHLAARSITSMMPTHFTAHHGWSAIFNDGDGSVTFLSDASMLTMSLMVRTFTTGVAHHGVAVIAFNHLVASVPDPVDPPMGSTRLPVGVSWRDRQMTATEAGRDSSCPRLHGEATNRDSIAFGCADGVLVLRWNSATMRFTPQKIANPMGTASTIRVGTLEAHESLPVYIGNWSREPALVIVDPAGNGGAGSITPFTLPTTQLTFKLDSEGAKLLVLTVDGRLHRLNPRTGASDGTPIQVIPAYAMAPSGEGAVRPALAITGDRAYVSDPRDGTVQAVDLERWAMDAPLMVGGAPSGMAVVSLSPDFHAAHMH
jgi:hypothetical protein